MRSCIVRKAGQNWTVEEWLNHWLNNIVAPPSITENAWSAYEIAVRLFLVPGVGAHRLKKLEPEHLEKLYRRLIQEGRKPKSATEQVKPAASARVHQVHRTIRAALNEAKRRRHITVNPAELARPPKVEEEEVEPYTVDEVRRLLSAAMERRNSARWAVALALGLRQGEALRLMWSDINLDAGAPCWSDGVGYGRSGSMDALSRAARSSEDTARIASLSGPRRQARSPKRASGVWGCRISSSAYSGSTRRRNSASERPRTISGLSPGTSSPRRPAHR